MSKNISKYYVVWEGNEKGIFSTWEECQKQTIGFPNAKYKSYPSLEAAQIAFKEGFKKHLFHNNKTLKATANFPQRAILESISVDAACNSKTGTMEYRGVYTHSKAVIFAQGPFLNATNNIGEFLAIVHALAHCQKNNINLPIYTDSQTAISWIKKKKANTKQEANEVNLVVFDLIKRAEIWLKNNTYDNPLLKWDTKNWGEIPADYGRK